MAALGLLIEKADADAQRQRLLRVKAQVQARFDLLLQVLERMPRREFYRTVYLPIIDSHLAYLRECHDRVERASSEDVPFVGEVQAGEEAPRSDELAKLEEAVGEATLLQVAAHEESNGRRGEWPAPDRPPLRILMQALEALRQLKSVTATFAWIHKLVSNAMEAPGTFIRGYPRSIYLAGNPGTGKTTTARHYFDILYGLGANISKTDSETATGGSGNYIGLFEGQSTVKTKTRIFRFYGKVQIVDEAESWAPGPRKGTQAQAGGGGDGNRYAKEAIDEVVRLLLRFEGLTTIVFVGYKAGIDRLLELNEGLTRRLGQPNGIVYPPWDGQDVVDYMYEVGVRLGIPAWAGIEDSCFLRHLQTILLEKRILRFVQDSYNGGLDKQFFLAYDGATKSDRWDEAHGVVHRDLVKHRQNLYQEMWQEIMATVTGNTLAPTFEASDFRPGDLRQGGPTRYPHVGEGMDLDQPPSPSESEERGRRAKKRQRVEEEEEEESSYSPDSD